VAKDKVASGTALRQTNLRDLTRSVAAAPVEQAMKVIVDVDMVGMTLDGAGFQCAVVCRARSRRKLQTSVGSTRWQLPKAPIAHPRAVAAGQPDRRTKYHFWLIQQSHTCEVSPSLLAIRTQRASRATRRSSAVVTFCTG
jgi:hypothetical protein